MARAALGWFQDSIPLSIRIYFPEAAAFQDQKSQGEAPEVVPGPESQVPEGQAVNPKRRFGYPGLRALGLQGKVFWGPSGMNNPGHHAHASVSHAQ
jgi:hypothetical protein